MKTFLILLKKDDAFFKVWLDCEDLEAASQMIKICFKKHCGYTITTTINPRPNKYNRGVTYLPGPGNITLKEITGHELIHYESNLEAVKT